MRTVGIVNDVKAPPRFIFNCPPLRPHNPNPRDRVAEKAGNPNRNLRGRSRVGRASPFFTDLAPAHLLLLAVGIRCAVVGCAVVGRRASAAATDSAAAGAGSETLSTPEGEGLVIVNQASSLVAEEVPRNPHFLTYNLPKNLT